MPGEEQPVRLEQGRKAVTDGRSFTRMERLGREAELAELAGLLRRGLAAHPQDLGLAGNLARLLATAAPDNVDALLALWAEAGWPGAVIGRIGLDAGETNPQMCLAGDSNLIAVRSRATLNRPFTVVRDLGNNALYTDTAHRVARYIPSSPGSPSSTP